METSVLAEWYVEEGLSFLAGETLAKIETKKASIDFEAQDDGLNAKILMEAGSGADIVVGTPIMVTVEEEDNIAGFADFALDDTAPVAESAPPVKEEAAPAPAVVAATAAPPSQLSNRLPPLLRPKR